MYFKYTMLFGAQAKIWLLSETGNNSRDFVWLLRT